MKSNLDQLSDQWVKSLFPGGREELLFRADVVVRLSNGKLPSTKKQQRLRRDGRKARLSRVYYHSRVIHYTAPSQRHQRKCDQREQKVTNIHIRLVSERGDPTASRKWPQAIIYYNFRRICRAKLIKRR